MELQTRILLFRCSSVLIWVLILVSSISGAAVPNDNIATDLQDESNDVFLDAFATKFRTMSDFEENDSSSDLKRKGGQRPGVPTRCDNMLDRYLCEQVYQKACYTSGKCGDLVAEENKK